MLLSSIEKIQLRNSGYQQHLYQSSTEFAVELRKKKRIERSQNKRMLYKPSEIQIDPKEFPSLLLNYKQILTSPQRNDELLISALKGIRLIVMRNPPPADLLVHSEIPHIIIEILQSAQRQEVLVECTWILCNICSGPTEAVQVLVELGVLDLVISLMKDCTLDVLEHLIWIIGNIAGDSISCCNCVIESNFIEALHEVCYESGFSNVNISKISIWTLANICTKQTQLPHQKVKTILEIFKLMKPFRHVEEIVNDWLRAICGISFRSDGHIQLIIENFFLEPVLNHMYSANKSILKYSLKTAGNLSSHTGLLTDILLQLNIFDKLEFIIRHEENLIRQNVYWCLSNIVADKLKHVETFMNHSIYHKSLQGIVDKDAKVREEASWVFSNIGIKGCGIHVLRCVRDGIFDYFSKALEEDNGQNLERYVKFTRCAMVAAKTHGEEEVAEMIASSGCLEAFEEVEGRLKGDLGEILCALTKSIRSILEN